MGTVVCLGPLFHLFQHVCISGFFLNFYGDRVEDYFMEIQSLFLVPSPILPLAVSLFSFISICNSA